MDNKEILAKYKDKILAVQSFGDNNKIHIDDFTDQEKLIGILYQLDCHEISLTNDGFDFIKDYYGLDQVVDMIMIRVDRGADFKNRTKDDIKAWLEAKGELES